MPHIAIIGAGVSGLIAGKTLAQAGLAVEIFEKGSGIGGLWRFGNDNGQSTAYRSLHINTVRTMMDLSDFKFPETAADYPGHAEILAFYERYVDHFDIRRLIRFRTEVVRAAPRAGGGWRLAIRDSTGEQSRDFDALVVANGHHWYPRLPDFKGKFDGTILHSHYYVDPLEPIDMTDKRIVVVGSGNSAMDIVCELGQAFRGPRGPKKVILSQRSGVWIIPKLIGDIPVTMTPRSPLTPPDEAERKRRREIPREERNQELAALMVKRILAVFGPPERVGLKAPKEPITARHPTVSQDIHSRLIHGDIVPKGNIVELRGKRVVFEDGTEEEIDVIVAATGYRIAFPFFDPALIAAPGNNISLWKRIFDPRFPDLAFIGLVQQRYCALMPLAELQCMFLRDYLTGEIGLPDEATMHDEASAESAAAKAEYTASESHTIQVDCLEYSWNLYEIWPRLKNAPRRFGHKR